MEILQEQFAGLIIFPFTLSRSCSCIPNIEARIFLDTHTMSGQHPVTKVVLIKKACAPNTYGYIIIKNI